MRGFQIAKGYEQDIITLPTRATKNSAGYDFCACKEITIKPHEIAFIETGVKAFMQEDEVLKIYPRSSLCIKKGLFLANQVGIIDADYYNNIKNDGHIMIMVYNFRDVDVTVEKGEKIAQGLFQKYLKIDGDLTVDVRNGGFGSTNLK